VRESLTEFVVRRQYSALAQNPVLAATELTIETLATAIKAFSKATTACMITSAEFAERFRRLVEP